MKSLVKLFLFISPYLLWGASISGELAQKLASANPDEFIPIVIIFREQTSSAELEQFKVLPVNQRREKSIEYLKKRAAEIEGGLIAKIKSKPHSFKNLISLFIVNAVIVDAKRELILHLEDEPSIERMELRRRKPALIWSPGWNLSPLETAWGVRHIGAPMVWNRYAVNGEGVLIAILDTGVDYHHPSLVNRVWKNPREIPWNGVDDDRNGYIDDVYGWDFVSRTPYAMDQKGHGTHVCGSACGDSLGGSIIGVAPGAKFVPLKVLDHNGNGEENWAWEGIQYALVIGANVANLSIGWRHSDSPDRSTWRRVVDNAIAAGLVVVAGAGNEGDETPAPNSVRTPGDVPSAITVGATDGSDVVADFSSVGPVSWSDVYPYYDYPYPPGLLKPDICAPGKNILSSVLGGGYESGWNGTSMATPHISGTVALMLQANPYLDPDSVKSILLSTAEDIWVAGPDTLSGYGRVNALRAVEKAMGDRFGTFAGSVFPVCPVKILNPPRTINPNPGGGFSVDLPAPGNYTAVFNSPFTIPETLRFHLQPDSVFYRSITLTPIPARTTNIEIRDFDNGELIPGGFVEFEGSYYESPPERPGIVILDLPVNVPLEFTAGAVGYISSRRTIFTDKRRIALFIHRAIDFETDSLFQPTAGRDWQWGTPRFANGPLNARSGSKCWATNLYGNYADRANSWLITPAFEPSEIDSPFVAFWHWYDFEATSSGWWDGGNVWLSVDEGRFELITPTENYTGVIDSFDTAFAGLPAFSGEQIGREWHQVQFDLSRYSGSRFIFLFRIGSDNNTPRPGWYIDDFAFVPRSKRAPFIWHTPFSDTLDGSVRIACRVVPVSAPLNPSSVLAHIFFAENETTLSLNSFPDYSDSFYCDFVPLDFTILEYRYYIEAEDIAGRKTKIPSSAPESLFTFYVYADRIPPIIEPIYRPKNVLSSASFFRIILRIRDPGGIDTSSVKLLYRVNFGEFQISRLYEVNGDDFTVLIPGPLDSFAYVEWYVEASDRAGNTRIYPADGYENFTANSFIRWDFQTEPHGVSEGIWEWGHPYYFPPSLPPEENLWATGLNEFYPDYALGILVLEEIDLFGVSSAYLYFDHYIDCAGSTPYPDGGDVCALDSQGELVKLRPNSGYDGPSDLSNPLFEGDSIFGGTSGWRRSCFSLERLCGKRFSIVFRFASDSAENSWGWFIDNLLITSSPVKIEGKEYARLDLALSEPFPNPANSSVNFTLTLPSSERVSVIVFNVLGQSVFSASYTLKAGVHNLSFSPLNFPSGLYFYTVSVRTNFAIRKVLIIK